MDCDVLVDCKVRIRRDHNASLHWGPASEVVSTCTPRQGPVAGSRFHALPSAAWLSGTRTEPCEPMLTSEEVHSCPQFDRRGSS